MKKLLYLILLPVGLITCGEETEGNETTDNKEKETLELCDCLKEGHVVQTDKCKEIVGKALAPDILACGKDTDSTAIETPTPMIGDAVQMVIGTTKYDETVEFYKTLGWKVEDAAEEPWKWTVLFDGSMPLLISEDTMNYIGPGYHSNKAEEIYTYLKEQGVEPMMSVPGNDGKPWFNVYAMEDSVGYSIVNEAWEMPEVHNVGDIFTTMDLNSIQYPNEKSGTFQEFSISVENLDESIEYWKKLGFVSNGVNEEPYSYTIMYDGLMTLGLHETQGMWHGNVFTYSGESLEENEVLIKELKAAGYKDNIIPMEFQGQVYPGNYLIADPAGNMFFLTTDFAKKNTTAKAQM